MRKIIQDISECSNVRIIDTWMKTNRGFVQHGIYLRIHEKPTLTQILDKVRHCRFLSKARFHRILSKVQRFFVYP